MQILYTENNVKFNHRGRIDEVVHRCKEPTKTWRKDFQADLDFYDDDQLDDDMDFEIPFPDRVVSITGDTGTVSYVYREEIPAGDAYGDTGNFDISAVESKFVVKIIRKGSNWKINGYAIEVNLERRGF